MRFIKRGLVSKTDRGICDPLHHHKTGAVDSQFLSGGKKMILQVSLLCYPADARLTPNDLTLAVAFHLEESAFWKENLSHRRKYNRGPWPSTDSIRLICNPNSFHSEKTVMISFGTNCTYNHIKMIIERAGVIY